MTSGVMTRTAFVQSLQTAYAIWVVSKPLLPWAPWAVVGMSLAILTQLRGPLTKMLTRLGVGQTAADGEQGLTDSPLGTPEPTLAWFLHRNYGLHVTGVFALLGADRLGSLALLGVGACIDVLREQWVVLRIVVSQPLVAEEQSETPGSWVSGTWTRRQLLSAWGICVGILICLFGVFSMLPVTGTIANSWLAVFDHILTGVAVPSGRQVPGLSEVELQRLGLVMSAGDLFVIVIPLFITWGATSACASVPRKYVLWPSPIVATLLTGGAVAIAYFIVVVTHLPGHLHSYEQFEKTTSAPVLLGIFLFIAVSNFAYYGQLTTMRLRDNTKPD